MNRRYRYAQPRKFGVKDIYLFNDREQIRYLFFFCQQELFQGIHIVVLPKGKPYLIGRGQLTNADGVIELELEKLHFINSKY